MALPLFQKLARGLRRTRAGLASTVDSLESAERIDESTLEELEAALLAADLGPELTEQVIDAVRAGQSGGRARAPLAAVRETLQGWLPPPPAETPAEPVRPWVVFVVGVNGGGKTTTVGKLAAREREQGRTAMIVAADTFRAAATEQLERWCDRAGASLVKQQAGADPAAVVFDALRAARARGIDTVLVDTAGRLHTKTNLMAELEKLARIAGREVSGAPHEVLLVVDATTGQNGLAQAREFTRATQLTGVVLTKLDGTAKGGVALTIHRALGVPIRFVGVGEKIDDLLVFDREQFLDGLLKG